MAPALAMTFQQLRHYEEHGFVVVRGVFKHGELDRAAKAVLRCIDTLFPWHLISAVLLRSFKLPMFTPATPHGPGTRRVRACRESSQKEYRDAC